MCLNQESMFPASTLSPKREKSEGQNGQDDAVSQAKYADGVNVGTQIVGNAEIMADYDPPEEACDIASVGKVSSSMHANGKAYSLALLEKLLDRQVPWEEWHS